MTRLAPYLATLGAAALTLASARATKPVRVRELFRERVGDAVYFRLRLAPPADLRAPRLEPGPYSEAGRRRLARLPQLVPQDGKTSAVYPRVDAPHFRPAVGFGPDRPEPVPVKGLEFVGKLHGKGRAKFLLLYPTGDEGSAAGKDPDAGLGRLVRRARWAEVPLEVDFNKARPAAPAGPYGPRRPAGPWDLEGLWAEAQAARLAVLEVQAPEFGFYGFACAATGRKYHVADPVLEGERLKDEEKIHRRLFELTTGTAAITQSLALRRLRGTGYRDRGKRTIDVQGVPGIDIASHDWKMMMGGRRPAPEPLAKLVPHDNYYFTCRDIRKFIELGEFIDQWGTTGGRAYEVQSRDYHVKERYERQLCLRSTWLARTLGPLVVRGVAVTGSDPYLREGSDVTVLFRVTDRRASLGAVEQFLRAARKEHGARLKETKEDYHGIRVERFVTPLREVSLHRAAFGEFVVCSNSPVGLRRVLDTYRGKLKSLWQSRDFQYMRTVFPRGDKEEDAFGFLSDAFIRQLVGPESKIKEMRRLEALTSLAMVTHGALFAAWETGKLPADTRELLRAARLRPGHIYVPEGKGITWDAGQQVAVSDAYNTLHFATPLIELPIDKITAGEERAYRDFHEEYLRLWRRYFDPAGLRFSLSDRRVRAQVYVLPLINNNHYRFLRELTGGRTLKYDLGGISPLALLQFTMSHEPYPRTGAGNWALIRLDDSPVLSRLADSWVRQELNARPKTAVAFAAEIFTLRLPIVVGHGVTDEEAFADGLGQLHTLADTYLGPIKTATRSYRAVRLTKITFTADSRLVEGINKQSNAKLSRVDLYHATVGGAWFLSLNQDCIKHEIDRALARKAGKGPGKGEVVKFNTSLHISPRAAVKAGAALRGYLEWETHKRALPNNALWYALYRCGLLAPDAPESAKQAAALTHLGFVPVSPDEAAYRYDARTGEVVNERHGSVRRPRLHAGLAEGSPLARMLEQFPRLRADMRFREDGLHATLTIARKGRR
jgi:hypothetical protein